MASAGQAAISQLVSDGVIPITVPGFTTHGTILITVTDIIPIMAGLTGQVITTVITTDIMPAVVAIIILTKVTPTIIIMDREVRGVAALLVDPMNEVQELLVMRLK